MTTRADVANLAMSHNGLLDGAGYDCPNPFSADLGRPPEAWCGDFVTDAFYRAGQRLPSMQPGCPQGFAFCPDAVDYARGHGAWKPSWEALEADLVLFDWNNNGTADHVELAIGWANGELATIGGNSGPSNTDHFRGRGGVHGHLWTAPLGRGNSLILGVIDTGRLVNFGGGTAIPARAAPPPAVSGPVRLLMAKSPMMTGPDVAVVQAALNSHGQGPPIGDDGIYGPHTRDAVFAFQRRTGIGADGVVGPQTRHALGVG